MSKPSICIFEFCDFSFQLFLQQMIFVSGDNDIGGEGFDRITPQKLNRFNKYFNNNEVCLKSSGHQHVCSQGFLDFLTVSDFLFLFVFSKILMLAMKLRLDEMFFSEPSPILV